MRQFQLLLLALPSLLASESCSEFGAAVANTELHGDDLSTITGTDTEGCCEACADNDLCVGFVEWASTCYLKGGFLTQSYSGGVMPSRGGPMPDSTILVQGGSLRTWSYPNPALEHVQVVLSSEGRPIDAQIELWQGPGNIPSKMRAFVENGLLRRFRPESKDHLP